MPLCVISGSASRIGDPRLFALQLVADHMAKSSQPLVPERVFVAGAGGENGQPANASQGLLGLLISLLVAEKSGFQTADPAGLASLQDFAEKMSKDAMDSMQQTALSAAAPTGAAELLQGKKP